MRVEQYVVAYQADQDRIRALLPEGFSSLRPVMRVNAEIRNHRQLYLELNTPVSGFEKRGWLNIAHWSSPELTLDREGASMIFRAEHLEFIFTATGTMGGCPAERDNDGCFYLTDGAMRFVPAERIGSRKESCDCMFSWKYPLGGAHGVSVGGKTLPALPTLPKMNDPKVAPTAENAAMIPCVQMLGQYRVVFDR